MAEPWATAAVAALVVWIAMGALSVLVLWRMYLIERAYRQQRHLMPGFIALTLALGSTVTFAAAAWAAFLTIRRLLGLEVIDWSALVTVPTLLLALSMPIGAAAVMIWQRYAK